MNIIKKLKIQGIKENLFFNKELPLALAAERILDSYNESKQ